MAFLEKIPSWLRWILFLPLALIAHFLAIVISMGLPEVLPGYSHLRQIFLWALFGGPSAFVFVWVGARVAPRAQFLISTNLAVVYGLFYGLALWGSWTELIANFGAGLIGAVVACYLFYKKGKAQDTEYEVIEINDQEE
jgi:hypothetical protein